ncbi:hypothetical protein [Actinoplanes sp. NBRC 101535]|uniref:hypothetical protein n=1 Tax=Actinoplanes sp. NBRC 101535 TaxID=3032196 RepID=UPI0024A3FF46|nr:hypothetical protein [Actinoplanes sp. NBRC 101535]GLY00649.1 hypothetical protein Acsp01_10280 [Actinoplanes sp. NBRC 101535]
MLTVLTAGFTTASCTNEDPSTPTPSSAPDNAATPSLTFEEAYQKLPMDGTERLPITWDLAGAPDTAVVLAARRSLAYEYWIGQSTEWAPVIAIGRYFYTDRHYEKFLAPFATTTSDNPRTGPVWSKVMGVEQSSTDQATVTFCTDLGYWHDTKDTDFTVREKRGTIQSYVMENVESGDGERHWLADRVLDPDADREAKYGKACTAWARHKP